MRRVKLLILVSLTSLQFTVFVAAQGPKHPEVKRRARESAPADKPGKWNRERKEDVKRGPEKESVDKKSREERVSSHPRARDKASAWDRRQDRSREPRPLEDRTSGGRDRDKRLAERRTVEKSRRWEQRAQRSSESKPSQRPQLLEHVFRGQLKKGEARGFHYEGGRIEATYGTKVIENTRTAPDARGVYEARVSVRGVDKRHKSSFFPRSWSRADVLKAINEGYTSRVKIAGRSPNYFEGRSSSGVKVGMYCNKNGEVVTAFPLYRQ
jgi:hypothetical protein